MFLAPAVLSVLLQIVVGTVTDYCHHNCTPYTNTICSRSPIRCGPDPDACGSKFKMLPLNDEEREGIVKYHNNIKNAIALGQTHLAQGRDLHVFSYSLEMEFFAQCWANHCGGKHDKCRRTAQHDSNQNMFMTTAFSNNAESALKHNWTGRAVAAWYKELGMATDEKVSHYHWNSGFGHLAQIMARKTSKVGCGRTVYGEEKKLSVVIFCNYGPAGAAEGAGVYWPGPPASDCERKLKTKPNKQYPGLCGEILPIGAIDEDWEPPFEISGSLSDE